MHLGVKKLLHSFSNFSLVLLSLKRGREHYTFRLRLAKFVDIDNLFVIKPVPGFEPGLPVPGPASAPFWTPSIPDTDLHLDPLYVSAVLMAAGCALKWNIKRTQWGITSWEVEGADPISDGGVQEPKVWTDVYFMNLMGILWFRAFYVFYEVHLWPDVNLQLCQLSIYAA